MGPILCQKMSHRQWAWALASLLQMALPSCVALDETPALSEHSVFVPCSLAPAQEQLAADKKWILGLGNTRLLPELCHLLMQELRFTEPLGGHSLCRSSVHSPLYPWQPSGVGSHCPPLMEKDVLFQDTQLLNLACRGSITPRHPLSSQETQVMLGLPQKFICFFSHTLF